MRSKLVTLAVLAACSSAAFAQSSVTVYGTADVGMVSESGGLAGSVMKIDSGVEAATRIGFRGIEDLGDGFAAIFVLETGILADTGGFDIGNLAFGRQAYVGLKGRAGTLTMGRQYNSYFVTESAVADPFTSGLAGRANNLLSPAQARTNNLAKYVTPSFNGFTAEFSYGFGEVPGNSSANRAIGFAAAYSQGPLNVRLGYNNLNTDTGNDSVRNTLLAANYNFDVAKLYLGYSIAKGAGANALLGANPITSYLVVKGVPVNAYGGPALASGDARDFLIGANIPFGQSNVLLSYIKKSDKEAADRSASMFAIGYTYALSKRTDIYTAYGHMSNSNGAGYTIGNNQNAGSGNTAFNLGLRNTF